jgi:hypothetical protein
MRDELLVIEQFGTLLEAQMLVDDCRVEYSDYRSLVSRHAHPK